MAVKEAVVRSRAAAGVSHTEGLHGEVLTKIKKSKILLSLANGSSPSDREPFDIDIKWSGADDVQKLSVIIELAFRPLNSGGFYWVLIAQIISDTSVDLWKGVFNRPCNLQQRHVVIAPTGDQAHAWLIPEEFDLHNPLVRDMIFSQNRDEEHRLIFTHLHALTSVFWRI